MKKLAICGLLALLAFAPPAQAKLIRFQDTDGSNRAVSPAYPLPTFAGGYEFNVQDTPTVQNAAYSASNCMGGFRSITVSRTASGFADGYVQRITAWTSRLPSAPLKALTQ